MGLLLTLQSIFLHLQESLFNYIILIATCLSLAEPGTAPPELFLHISSSSQGLCPFAFRCKSSLRTRLESKVFSLERLYPLLRVEVSYSQTNIGSKEIFESNKTLWVQRNFASAKNFGPKKKFGVQTIFVYESNF